MAKFRTKLKGSSKGKRWPKGMSSSSNPSTHKFRDASKAMGFKRTTGPSSLTVKALQIHDNKMDHFSLSTNNQDNMEVDDETCTQTSYSTADSFASSWSGCTNMSFNKFLQFFRADSQIHKEMLAVLAAAREVITKEKGNEEEPSATSYFCVLMVTLEEMYKDEDQVQVAAILALLTMSIGTVPDALLKSKFDEITQKMLIILKDYAVSDNNLVIKSLLGILGHMLKIMECTSWNSSNCIEIFNALLDPFCIHSKPKWRKSAQEEVIKIVKDGSFKQVSPNLPAIEVAKFCEKTFNAALGQSENTVVLVSSLKKGQTTILHTLSLLKGAICFFPKKYIKSSCEIILRLITLNYPMVTYRGFEVLHCLFSAQKAVIPAQLNGQLITALYDYQPSIMDDQATHAWLTVMQQAHIHLADVDLSMACEAFPKIFAKFTQLWTSEKPATQKSVTYVLEILLKDAVTPACATEQLVEQYKLKLSKVFNTLENSLGYQYHNVWHHVLHVISVMFEAGGWNCREMFRSTLNALTELRDSYKFTFNNELEHAVGAAIRALGPEIVLETIPLRRDNGDINIDRSWLLPVLRENVKNSTLEFFIKNILSLAMFCHRRSIELAEANNNIGAHSAQLLYFQLWSLLPSFCNCPTDIKKSFQSLARTLGTAINDKKDLRLPLMAALRRLINFAKSKEDRGDLEELAKFDKNYIPILFNIYTTKPIGSDEEGQRLAAMETIKLFLSISRPELNGNLFNDSLRRLKSSSDDPEDSFIKESVLDLIRALVSYQSIENIEILYNQCVKNLPQMDNKKEQKKCYRIFEEICSSESENCKAFLKKHRKEMQRLLKASMETAAVSTKGARLRCFHYLLKAQPQLDHESKFLRTVIPEAILAFKDINEKCRATAVDVLQTIGERLIYDDHVQEFMTLLLAGLGGTIEMISCTILALASILHHFSGCIGQENIQRLLDNVLLLSTSPTRDIVGSCLVFIRTYIKILPSPIVGSSLSSLMKSFYDMSEDCKGHFRLKVRDIISTLVRKFGTDGISSHIPKEDIIMFKRIRNLRKKEERKQRSSLTVPNEEEEEDEFMVNSKHKSVDEILADSDSDLEDMDTEERKQINSKKNNKYIQEDPDSIVDFADPSAMSRVTAAKPVKKASTEETKKSDKNRGFKTAADGRLVIKDDSSDSETDEKDNMINLKSDSDDESVETMPLTNRKRKSCDTVSMSSGKSGHSSKKYKPGGKGIHRSLDASSVRSVTTAGSEYRSKKSKGDVKKKDKFDPYAYLPLRRSALNKRNKNNKKKGTNYFL